MASWASWFPGTFSARLGKSGGVRTTQTDFDGGALDWLLGALAPAGGWDLPPDEDMFQHCPLSAWASRHRPVSSLSTAATVRTPAFTRPMTTGGHTPRTHLPPRCQAPSSSPRFLCPEGESGLDQGLSDPPPPFRCEFSFVTHLEYSSFKIQGDRVPRQPPGTSWKKFEVVRGRFGTWGNKQPFVW